MKTECTFFEVFGNRLTVEIPAHALEDLERYQQGDNCKLELTRPKDKRTLEQNKYIWVILDLIDKKINGYQSDIWNLYKQLVKQARIKIEYFETLEDAKPYLEETFRVVEEVERRTSAKGKETVLYACYPGTSQFSKKEMANFIEVLLGRAYNEGLDVMQYEDLLKGGNNE